MLFRNIPIQKKLMRILLLICGVVLLITGISFFVYEYYTFRESAIEKLSTIGKIISANSTAALAFSNQDDAKEILSAIKTEPHITAACLYDKEGKIFAWYPSDLRPAAFPVKPGAEGYQFLHSNLEGFQQVAQDTRILGTLYLRSDMGALYERFRLYGIAVAIVIIASLMLAYPLSRILQKNISKPILDLAGTARIISEQKDYSVRAVKSDNDEIGTLTNAFNEMLDQIEVQNNVLNEFNQKLEQKVSERTAQLETVNRELEAFSYSISHDLRAPLRGVVGFAAILEEDYSNQLDDEAKRVISVIKGNTLKMGQLIDDLLTFSRMGRQDIIKDQVPTNILVKEVINQLAPENKVPEITWIVYSLPDVRADINMLRQVWINLISNAIKYSGTQKHPTIEIGIRMEHKQQVFFVKDNGVGFDQQYKDKLFKVFQRLHSEDEFEGTGIGLAIVEKIISKHGGKVWAESAPHKGACFYFSLPEE